MSGRYRILISCGLLLILMMVIAQEAVQSNLAQEVDQGSKPQNNRQLLERLVETINSGDDSQIDKFVKDTVELRSDSEGERQAIVARFRELFLSHGGLEVKRMVHGDPTFIRAVMTAKRDDGWIDLMLRTQPSEVGSAPNAKIIGFGFGDIAGPTDLIPKNNLTDAELHQKISSVIGTLAERDAFSGVVVAHRHGQTVFCEAFGPADTQRKSLNTIATRFHLASITKMFTAIAIAQLVESGKLHWDDTLASIVDDYPNQAVAKAVTIHQLLSHTSGLVGAQQTVNQGLMPKSARTVVESWGTAVDQPLLFRPGQQYEYSNFGYSVLGRVIEVASGQSYHDYVRKHVFEPSGMTCTEFVDLEGSENNVAVGFMDDPEGTRIENRSQLSAVGMPFGGAYSTADDLNNFRVALLENKLVTEATLQRMWTGVCEPESNSQYGYGTQIADYNGYRFIYHGGGWPGVTNHFEFCPELDCSFVILSNYDINTQAITYRMRQWLTQRPDNLIESTVQPEFAITATQSNKQIEVGTPVTLQVQITGSVAVAHSCIVDLEFKDPEGNKIEQQFTMQQRFDPGVRRPYTYTWTPTKPGNYSVDVGIFRPNWGPSYTFLKSIGSINAR